MKTISAFFMLLSLSIFTFKAQALDFKIVPKAGGSLGILVDVPYVAGVHHGIAQQVEGLINVSSDFKLVTGKLKVPISSIVTGNPTRDCHMRESLGLDYSVSSFPGKHVCNGQNELPKSGNDAVVFEFVEFQLTGVSVEEDPATLLQPGKSFVLQAAVQWSIHGKSKLSVIPFKINILPDGSLTAKADIPMLTSEFGIIVKPVLGFGINGQIKVSLDALLAVQR